MAWNSDAIHCISLQFDWIFADNMLERGPGFLLAT